jgi:tape measure domain-containing protein
VSVIGKLIVAVVGDMSALRKDLNNMQKDLKRTFGKEALDASKALTTGVLGLGAGLAAAGAMGVKFAADLEQTQIAFEVLTGSADTARQMIDEFREMGAKTPYETKDLLDAAQTMMLFGIEADKVKGYLQNLGDVAAGDANKLKMLTLAFSQVQSAGKLTGNDLLQMINSGFNPLQIISEKTGKSMAVLKDQMSQGAISSQMVADAFKIATSEGGLFNGMMERQSQSINGLVSSLKDGLGIALTSVGQNIIETTGLHSQLKDLTATLNEFADELKTGGIGEALSKMIPPGMQVGLLGISGAIAGGMVPALKDMAINIAKMLPLALNPWVIGLTAAGLAIGGVIALMNQHKNATEKELKSVRGQRENLESLTAEYQQLTSKASLTADEKKRVFDISNKIADIAPTVVKGYDDEGNAILDLNEALKVQVALKGQELRLRQKQIDDEVKNLENRNQALNDEIKFNKEFIAVKESQKSAYETAEQTSAREKLIARTNKVIRENSTAVSENEVKLRLLKDEYKNISDLLEGKVTTSLKETTKNTKEQTTVTLELNDELKKTREKFETEWTDKLLQETGTRRQILEAEYQDAIAQADKLGADKTAIEAYYKEQRMKLMDEENAAKIAAMDVLAQAIAESEERDRQALEEEKKVYREKAATVIGYVDAVNTGQKTLKDIIKEQLLSWLTSKQVEILASIAAGIATATGQAPFTFGASLAWIPALLSQQGLALGVIEAAKGAIRGLATGGYVPAQPGGIIANIGEGREGEIVAPLETGTNLIAAGIVDILSRMANTSGSVTSNYSGPKSITIINQMDGVEMGRVVAPVVVEEIYVKTGMRP